MFLDKMVAIFRILNGWASEFQISFKIWTICNPTSFQPFKIQTSLNVWRMWKVECSYKISKLKHQLMFLLFEYIKISTTTKNVSLSLKKSYFSSEKKENIWHYKNEKNKTYTINVINNQCNCPHFLDKASYSHKKISN